MPYKYQYTCTGQTRSTATRLTEKSIIGKDFMSPDHFRDFPPKNPKSAVFSDNNSVPTFNRKIVAIHTCSLVIVDKTTIAWLQLTGAGAWEKQHSLPIADACTLSKWFLAFISCVIMYWSIQWALKWHNPAAQ